MWIRAEAKRVKGLAHVAKPGLYPGVCWMKYPWGVQNRGPHERESVRILRRTKGREWASERRQDRWEGTSGRTLSVCQGPMNGPSFEESSSRPKGLWEVETLVLRMWFSGGTSMLRPRFWDSNFVTFWGILLKFDNCAYMPKPVSWKFWEPVGKWIYTWADIWWVFIPQSKNRSTLLISLEIESN